MDANGHAATALPDSPRDWTRGVLPLLVLRTLADGASYGYAIATTISRHGFGEVPGSTLYPLLARLSSDGLVTAHWRAGEGGPGRKYFDLTATGESAAERLGAHWYDFASRTHRFLKIESR